MRDCGADVCSSDLLCVSRLENMGPGTSFHRVMYDDLKLCDDKDVKRVVLCSGKVYYDLFEEREKQGTKDVLLLRLEQLSPFPDRKSDVSGKSVSVRVDLGGRSLIQKTSITR